MGKTTYTKLGRAIIGLHALLALLSIAYFLLTLGGMETVTNTSGGEVDVFRYRVAMLILFLIGVSLSVPISITNILYFAKHLKPGDWRRIPVLISILFFGCVSLFILLGLALTAIGFIQGSLRPQASDLRDELKIQLLSR